MARFFTMPNNCLAASLGWFLVNLMMYDRPNSALMKSRKLVRL